MAVNATLDDDEPLAANREEGDAPEDEAAGKGGFDARKIILFVLLPLFLLIGVGGGLYFSGVLDKFTGKEDAAGETAEHGGDTRVTAKTGGAYFLEIPNMLVNLSSTDGQPRYLRLSVQLELENQADIDAVQAVMPRVVDQFQTYLRELRIKDLRGSAGMYRLQMELLSRVNAAAYPIEVKDVLFQEILIQ